MLTKLATAAVLLARTGRQMKRGRQRGIADAAVAGNRRRARALVRRTKGTSAEAMLETGRNCWRIERAGRASLIVDAADYFRLVRQAMVSAERQILLIGWDFDTRIALLPKAADEGPTELGPFLSWLPKQRPGLEIHILKWDLGAIKLLGRGTTPLRLAWWAARNDIHFKLDGAHAPGVRTDPAQAAAFVEATGVDGLAVAVGSSHAMVDRSAQLDLELIARLAAAVPVPLVLHGSSGVPDEAIAAAVTAGIRKVNIGTALNVAYTAALRESLTAQPDAVDPRRYTRDSRAAMAAVVARFCGVVGPSRAD